MSITAGMVCFAIFVLKLTNYLNPEQLTRVAVDTARFGEELRINLDIELFDLACDFVVVGVRDTFGNVRPNVTKNMQKISIDQVRFFVIFV